MKLGPSFWKKIALAAVGLVLVAVLASYFVYTSVKSSLPQMITVKDYQPLLVSQVYDRNDKKIGEFFRERRTLVPFDKMPKNLINAFLAAEDDQFYQHGGINYVAILRAALANIRAGHTVQGASTITQQLAKTLLLKDNERTMLRKVREAMLAQQVEDNLSKDDILYLYLNQIYFGQGAYGVENAAQTYFHKPVSKISLAEMAILAGLPKAPSAYSPVTNPSRAKERQVYVLHRMAEVGMITKQDSDKAAQEPVRVYVRENYEDTAPYFLEAVRLLLFQQLGEETVLDQGVRIWTSLDVEKQKSAQDSVLAGLKELDKRQGYRGPLKHLEKPADIEKFLKEQQKELISDSTPERTIMPDGQFAEITLLKTRDASKNLPTYIKKGQTIPAIVEAVDDTLGAVTVQMPESRGLIDFETMRWARRPDTEKKADLDQLKKPSEALKTGDVILVRVVGDKASLQKQPAPKKKGAPVEAAPDLSKYAQVELDQEPLVEGSLLSFDQQSEDVLAMVGGSKFVRNSNEFNRALQASRQTGSAFKAIVYASALDKGYNPSSPVMDAPVVYEETKEDDEGQEDTKVWKPENHGKTFGGEITFRNAIVKSLNVPTVKIIEEIGVPWSADYARRFGVFSPLNMDFTLALGSSSLTLYEMTKVFSQFGRMGKRIHPMIIKKVEDRNGKVLLQNVSLDLRFQKEMAPFEEEFENRRKAYLDAKAANPDMPPEDPKKQKTDSHFFFQDADQLIKPQTAYVMTSLLKGVVEDPHGTGGRARSIGRETAGKTGTTNGYFDAWFIGFTAQIATGVWVGFDKEKSLGKGEVGGRAALPIWVDYMKSAHEGLPQMTLPVPDGIVFANIDAETGQLASANTKHLLRQAFVEGTEPTSSSKKEEETSDFYKQDLSD